MKEIASAVTALLAFLIPLGIYCMLLAFINRRTKPLIVHGVWDAIGLLGAMSGFLLFTAPMLLDEFCQRVFGVIAGPYLYAVLWIGYYAFLAICGIVMVVTRASKTMIYNVDTKVFPILLQQAIARIGLQQAMQDGRVKLLPAPPDADLDAISEQPLSASHSAKDNRHAELVIENFGSMCHVTLHWEQSTPHVRSQVEEELERVLELAAPEENAAAGWFYSISGLIFGALFMVAGMILVIIFLPRH
jgi:hypothetical protein